MVAKITSPTKVIAALNYNENKVQEGKAECLHGSGYLRNTGDMDFYQKLEGFERLNSLNSRATTKTLHISLNFDPSEKISKDRLISIASDYMEKIGFGAQPWLMYRHNDAGHPHIHIVTTTIQADGKRIDTYNIGRNQSEKARKEIEQAYGLIPAENQKRLLRKPIAPVQAEKIGYGKTETKKSITNVINAILNTYRYCSLPEFNAILKSYNVVADRGQEDGRIYKHRGLVYRVLDAKSNKVGVPIKASSINSNPILEKLDALFEKNKLLKEPFRAGLKNTIDQVLAQHPRDIATLVRLLEQKNVVTVLRQNEQGRIYGITFIDRNNKCVFNGSDIGKQYSFAHLEERLAAFSQLPVNQKAQSHKIPFKEQSQSINILDVVITPREEFNYTSGALLKKKRKKKRRSLGL
ncbi:MAG: relaxase/mobilization nuclease domain-containing protein [Bacteroidetes bacterium]|nr:relaxase/mobilization nuclease domain-containing protein [Bacteroidota bacterium]